MPDDAIETLKDIKGDLQAIAKYAEQAPEPLRGILVANLFITLQKVRYLLGESDGVAGGAG